MTCRTLGTAGLGLTRTPQGLPSWPAASSGIAADPAQFEADNKIKEARPIKSPALSVKARQPPGQPRAGFLTRQCQQFN
jgi:hypothetical protein